LNIIETKDVGISFKGKIIVYDRKSNACVEQNQLTLSNFAKVEIV
jgi:hypothetical protein